MMGDLTRNFSRWEFACSCGCGFGYGRADIDLTLVDGLQGLRDYLNEHLSKAYIWRIHVNSGCRCESHNRDVGGSKTSQHLLGKAADIVAIGHTDRTNDRERIIPCQLAPIANEFDVFHDGGIGVYDTFLHVDVRWFIARWGKEWEHALLEKLNNASI